MRSIGFCFAVLLISTLAGVLSSCKDADAPPDVSTYKADVTVQRFDTAFFNLDTNRVDFSMQQLQQRYPNFLPGYLTQVLGVVPSEPQALDLLTAFLRSYQGVARAANAVMEKYGKQEAAQLSQSLKYLQHYVPGFHPEQPFVLTSFIGPMNAYEPFATGDYGEVRTQNGVGLALQFHLGADAEIYDEGARAGVLNQYQTRRFLPQTMSVNAVKTVIEDLFPYKPASLNLVEDMVEKGKRLYLLELCMPAVHDSLQLGYTGEQLKGCEANEALIWNYFVKNDLLYSKDPLINQHYIKDGPSTPELGEGAPGYIGLWLGRQIVRSYVQQQKEVNIKTMMEMAPAALFNQAGYKP